MFVIKLPQMYKGFLKTLSNKKKSFKESLLI